MAEEKARQEEAARLLHDRDWSKAQRAQPRPTSHIMSTRLDGETAVALTEEAHRRGISPSALIREYVKQGLASRDQAGKEPVPKVVPLDELQAAIERLARPEAA